MRPAFESFLRWSIQGKNKLQSTWRLFGFDYSRRPCRFDYQTMLYQIEFRFKRICCCVHKVNMVIFERPGCCTFCNRSLRKYQPESVYVLPKTSKARIIEIYSPEEYKKMPKKMQWEDLRRYWRRVYGYLLSPNPEPCVDIEFYRGKLNREVHNYTATRRRSWDWCNNFSIQLFRISSSISTFDNFGKETGCHRNQWFEIPYRSLRCCHWSNKKWISFWCWSQNQTSWELFEALSQKWTHKQKLSPWSNFSQLMKTEDCIVFRKCFIPLTHFSFRLTYLFLCFTKPLSINYFYIWIRFELMRALGLDWAIPIYIWLTDNLVLVHSSLTPCPREMTGFQFSNGGTAGYWYLILTLYTEILCDRI